MKGRSKALSLIDRFLIFFRQLLAPPNDFEQPQATLELAAAHHIFRHIKKSWIDGDFIEPAAFRPRLNEDEHKSEKGLQPSHNDDKAIAALKELRSLPVLGCGMAMPHVIAGEIPPG